MQKAVMHGQPAEEVHDGQSAEGVHMDVLYKSPDYSGPLPDFSEKSPSDVIFAAGGSTIARLCSDIVVKFGTRVSRSEADSMLFVQERAPSVPAPRVYACYTIGPFARDVEDCGSLYDTYIIMSYAQGQTLAKAWDGLREEDRDEIAAQLCSHLQELRAISNDSGTSIGALNGGPIADPILEMISERGPFSSEDEFNEALVSACENNLPRANLRPILEGALAQQRHEVVFTHGDLRAANIMVDGAKVTGIVDWEMSGWYPEYWEYVKSFHVWGWPKDWPGFVARTMQPYYPEWFVYELITRGMV